MSTPHPKLLALLKGPRVPDDFQDDGCSVSPDWWFRWACRIHDYEYHLLRTMTHGTREWKRGRRLADVHLKQNIRILSSWRVRPDGTVSKAPLRVRGLLGYYLGHVYYRAVRLFGRRAALPERDTT